MQSLILLLTLSLRSSSYLLMLGVSSTVFVLSFRERRFFAPWTCFLLCSLPVSAAPSSARGLLLPFASVLPALLLHDVEPHPRHDEPPSEHPSHPSVHLRKITPRLRILLPPPPTPPPPLPARASLLPLRRRLDRLLARPAAEAPAAEPIPPRLAARL